MHDQSHCNYCLRKKMWVLITHAKSFLVTHRFVHATHGFLLHVSDKVDEKIQCSYIVVCATHHYMYYA